MSPLPQTDSQSQSRRKTNGMEALKIVQCPTARETAPRAAVAASCRPRRWFEVFGLVRQNKQDLPYLRRGRSTRKLCKSSPFKAEHDRAPVLKISCDMWAANCWLAAAPHQMRSRSLHKRGGLLQMIRWPTMVLDEFLGHKCVVIWVI